ncbi:MAG: hypothetical protein CMN91_09560 [Synechococcus sp. ARS1019]|nr:hypothetical protein [Synechococcus sp. ARS1019]|tara:strand:+ start:2386 stop:2766 length:381 start_codon:yes stop_codon:yes gene_type:complete
MIRVIASVLLGLLIGFGAVPNAMAGPVEWIEVPATEAGQQWWDRGSIREDRQGMRTVLSRFTPAANEDGDQPNGSLYVMQVDCGQGLYKDKQVNGIPRFRSEWQPAGNDDLIDSVIKAVCTESLTS